jgi:hypothetical protein
MVNACTVNSFVWQSTRRIRKTFKISVITCYRDDFYGHVDVIGRFIKIEMLLLTEVIQKKLGGLFEWQERSSQERVRVLGTC